MDMGYGHGLHYDRMQAPPSPQALVMAEAAHVSPTHQNLMLPPPNRAPMVGVPPRNSHHWRPRPSGKSSREQVRFMPRRSKGHWQKPEDIEYRRMMIIEM
jgi:hypothetical protein